MISWSTLLTSAAIATSALAHMEMQVPPPLLSKFNPNVPEPEIDYNMNFPLSEEHGFPCKGYFGRHMNPVATWYAGQEISTTIYGSAIHGGGSCQWSLSYDLGKTWSTIRSRIGGCLIEGLTDRMILPKEAPTGTALFAWTWFNNVGNREEYMNCAVVNIQNGGSRLVPAIDFPPPFTANAFVNECKTIEFTDPVFPFPGRSVHYGGAYNGTVPSPGGTYIGSNCVPPGQSEPTKSTPPTTTEPHVSTCTASCGKKVTVSVNVEVDLDGCEGPKPVKFSDEL